MKRLAALVTRIRALVTRSRAAAKRGARAAAAPPRALYRMSAAGKVLLVAVALLLFATYEAVVWRHVSHPALAVAALIWGGGLLTVWFLEVR